MPFGRYRTLAVVLTVGSESMGAKPLSEWEHMRVERDALEELARRVPYDAVKRE